MSDNLVKHGEVMGTLYQLVSPYQLGPLSFVKVNGPHDTYGRVVKSEPKEDGAYLNLIRGVGRFKRDSKERVAYDFKN